MLYKFHITGCAQVDLYRYDDNPHECEYLIEFDKFVEEKQSDI